MPPIIEPAFRDYGESDTRAIFEARSTISDKAMTAPDVGIAMHHERDGLVEFEERSCADGHERLA